MPEYSGQELSTVVDTILLSQSYEQIRELLSLEIGADVQAHSAELDGLAAADQVAIYYRSAAGVWSPVTIGSGLQFADGVLSVTGGGGSGIGFMAIGSTFEVG